MAQTDQARTPLANNLRGWDEDLGNVRGIVGAIPVRVVFLQPRATVEGEIGFDELVDWLRQFDDPISSRFRESLIAWHDRPAGECLA